MTFEFDSLVFAVADAVCQKFAAGDLSIIATVFDTRPGMLAHDGLVLFCRGVLLRVMSQVACHTWDYESFVVRFGA